MTCVTIEPPSRCVDITQSDTLDIAATTGWPASGGIPYARALRVLTDGTLKITTRGGDIRNYTVTAGQLVDWVSVSRVWDTGSTCTVEALY